MVYGPESFQREDIPGERIESMTHPTKVAIITGASRGIGAALVPAYRKLGYAVVASARSITDAHDPDILTIAADVGQPGAGGHIVDAALDRFGRVDTLINNAGIFIAKPFTEYTDEDYDAITGVNLRGFFEVSRRAVAAMLDQGGGHVVNVSTSLVDHASSAVPSGLASLTKGGLNAVTKSLAIEYASRGIRANAVALGIIGTPMHPPETHAALARMHPLGRIGHIDDVVDAIVYLENASFVTGEILHVDGGQSAGH
jgi:NAD(P)-dependent dehydrogenase (short-subunit alcohol dehydrogenase family)